MKKIYIVFISLIAVIVSTGVYIKYDENISVDEIIQSFITPSVFSNDLRVETYAEDLVFPTTMSFVGEDLLVLEKDGNVKLIKDGNVHSESNLSLDVNSFGERGLLGITTFKNHVYLYFTQEKSNNEIHNYIYQYQWNGSFLVNPQLISILPGENAIHNGGAMTTDEKGNVYAVIGDQANSYSPITKYGILQNILNGTADDRGVIIKVGLNEPLKPSETPNPFDHYYAIGIRNSFGLAIDPFTGNLWDTENGWTDFDEINLVLPKFNSGWIVSMGPATDEQKSKMLHKIEFKYNDPKFSWEETVTPTGITFVNSEKFEKFHNVMFVGDCVFGNLYKFTLNENRTEFVFKDPNLIDLVVNYNPKSKNPKNLESMEEILFGQNFGCITDLEFGPDGNLYVISIYDGKIYKISPR